jgi:hypothetical protein
VGQRALDVAERLDHASGGRSHGDAGAASEGITSEVNTTTRAAIAGAFIRFML